MQLPSTSPNAMSGRAASAVAPNPVNSSGRLVVAASRTTPIQLRPSPVFSPSTSPYRARRTPARTMTSAVAANWTQIIGWRSACCRFAVSVAAQACSVSAGQVASYNMLVTADETRSRQ